MSVTRETSAAGDRTGSVSIGPGRRDQPVPGPHGARLGLDHLAELDADFLGYTSELARKYGDCVHYRVGLVPTYQFTNPAEIQEVLVTKSKSFRKTDRLRRVLGRILGNSLLLNEGVSWAGQRAILQPAFHPHRIPDYTDAILRHTEAMLARHGGQAVEIGAALHRLTLLTTAEVLVGADLSADADQFVAAVATVQRGVYPEFTSRAVASAGPAQGQRAAMAEAIDYLQSVIGRIVDERSAAPGPRDNLLGHLLAAHASSAELSRRQVRDEVMIMLAGGAGTTATALTWTAYLLARHQTAQQRVRDEVDRVVAGRRPTSEDVAQLEFTRMVLNESMRLYPPAYTTSRQAIRAVNVGGYDLPAGANVHLIPYITHRDPRWFASPLAFRPERFADDAAPAMDRFAFIPFGSGPRACIGGGLAMQTGLLVLATILVRHGLELASEQSEPELDPKISLHPKGGIQLRLTVRNDAAP